MNKMMKIMIKMMNEFLIDESNDAVVNEVYSYDELFSRFTFIIDLQPCSFNLQCYLLLT